MIRLPERRRAMQVVAIAAIATASCARSPASRSVSSETPPWGSVLSGAGGAAAELFVGRLVPPCLAFSDPDNLYRTSAALSQGLAKGLGVDLSRRARSAVVQRRLESARYALEVVRLEVQDGIFLPLNVYVPRGRTPPAGIVLSPVGCGSSCGSPDVQTRAANLSTMGFLVLVSEGFCSNGARSGLPDSDPRVNYDRLLLGLSSDSAIHAQELVAALTWALEAHPPAHRDRVGVAGYSYGGTMGLLLAYLDRRVRTVSVPATGVGEPCDARPLALSDVYLQEVSTDLMWSAPLGVPVLPRNAGVVMTFPRYLHTTAGTRDRSAPAELIGGAMGYASEIYAMASLRERIAFR